MKLFESLRHKKKGFAIESFFIYLIFVFVSVVVVAVAAGGKLFITTSVGEVRTWRKSQLYISSVLKIRSKAPWLAPGISV